jgi:hypothetical protein
VNPQDRDPRTDYRRSDPADMSDPEKSGYPSEWINGGIPPFDAHDDSDPAGSRWLDPWRPAADVSARIGALAIGYVGAGDRTAFHRDLVDLTREIARDRQAAIGAVVALLDVIEWAAQASGNRDLFIKRLRRDVESARLEALVRS